MTTRVIVGTVYRFHPMETDRMMPEHYDCVPGQLVRVVNLPHCPVANTLGQCHVADAESGVLLGMVATASLFPVEVS